MPTTIAITGAAGHLGNVLCRLLLEQGHQVRALCRSYTRSLQGLHVDVVQGDLLHRPDLERLMSGCDAVVHCAAIISIHGDPTGEVFRTNTEGPRLVLEVAAKLGLRRMVHVSSVHAAIEAGADVFDEDRPYKGPKDYAYDYSKAVGEQMVLFAPLPNKPEVVVVRPSAIVGPYDFKPSEIGKGLLQFYSQRIPILPEGGYDFVDVRDVAASVANALRQGRSGEVYLLTGKYHSMRELAAVIGQVTGKRMPQWVLPYRVLRLLLPPIGLHAKITGSPPLFTIEAIDALRNGHPRMDNSKAVRELGHRCRPLSESIRDFYLWHPSTKLSTSDEP